MVRYQTSIFFTTNTLIHNKNMVVLWSELKKMGKSGIKDFLRGKCWLCFIVFFSIIYITHFWTRKKIEYEKSNKRGVSKVCYMTNSIIELYPAATNRMRPLNPSPLLTMSQHKGLLSLWNNNTSWVQLPSLGMDTRSPENPLWSRGPTKWDYFFCSWNENRTPRNLELYLPLFQMMLQMMKLGYIWWCPLCILRSKRGTSTREQCSFFSSFSFFFFKNVSSGYKSWVSV